LSGMDAVSENESWIIERAGDAARDLRGVSLSRFDRQREYFDRFDAGLQRD